MELVENSKEYIHIALSESNLKALLAKLQMPNSTRIIKRLVNDPEDNANYISLIVQAVPDDDMYAERKRGIMSPDTERIMKTL